MPADLTGLTPYRQASSKVLEQSFEPGGGVPEEKLLQEFRQRMWGTGTTPGVASEFARKGIRELQPEFQYAFTREMREAGQKLADQYATRQRAAIDTGRTTEMVEPNFRAGPEASASGYYEGLPTLARTEAETKIASLNAWIENENRKLSVEKMKGIGGAIGSGLEALGIPGIASDALRSLLGLPPRGGSGGGGAGGAAGTALGGVGAAASLAQLAEMLGIPLPSLLTASGIPASAIPGLIESGNVVTALNLGEELAGLGAPAAAGVGASLGPAAPSIEAGLIEMLGPELAAKLGYAAAPIVAGTGTGIALGGAAGAELLPMAAGSLGAEGLGLSGFSAVAAPAAALAVPLIVKQIIESLSLGGNFKPAYDTAANSLVPKVATYEARQLGTEILGGDHPLVRATGFTGSGQLPPMDILASADMIARKIGLDSATIAQQVPMYNQSRPQVAAKVAEIMVRENRWPTQEEFLQAARDVGTPPPSPFAPNSGAAYMPVWNGSQWVQSSQYPGGVFEPR